MFSTWKWHTREGKTQMRLYKEKEFFQWHRREFDFFSGTEGFSLQNVLASSWGCLVPTNPTWLLWPHSLLRNKEYMIDLSSQFTYKINPQFSVIKYQIYQIQMQYVSMKSELNWSEHILKTEPRTKKTDQSTFWKLMQYASESVSKLTISLLQNCNQLQKLIICYKNILQMYLFQNQMHQVTQNW
jgi:hypothetical protein